MRTLVIDGHPNPASLTSALALRYAQAHPDADTLALRDLDLDLVLHQGLRGEQRLEPDLVDAAERVVAADQITLATPVWWDSTPALVKGFFDRLLQAGWAYRYRAGLPQGLLAGRRGRLLLTADSPWWYLRFLKGDVPIRQVSTGTLRFVGIKPVAVTRHTGVRTSTPAQRRAWLDRAAALGESDGARAASGSRRDPGPLPAGPVH